MIHINQVSDWHNPIHYHTTQRPWPDVQPPWSGLNLQLRNMARPQKPNMMATLIKGYSNYLQLNEQQQILKDRRDIGRGIQGERRGG